MTFCWFREILQDVLVLKQCVEINYYDCVKLAETVATILNWVKSKSEAGGIKTCLIPSRGFIDILLTDWHSGFWKL